jgi:hypothetical protein
MAPHPALRADLSPQAGRGDPNSRMLCAPIPDSIFKQPAIHRAAKKKLDCFVVSAPRNDGHTQ